MNRISAQLAIATLSLVSAGGLMVGCSGSHMTEGQKTQQQANGVQNSADLIRAGELHKADGEAEIARGESIKKAGDDVEGNRLIAHGKVTQAQGESEIEQGKKLKSQSMDK